ncbi:uncharacterized protein LOC143485729 [Brachyhypopomus gauderio]|uniref:uncharacterized protein LOC143485729 n=1 Tax=Brachyhypopomus gauderio TaxID=698409 RepID=UPI0040428C07
MPQAFTSLIRLFVMVFGNTMNSHEKFMEYLKLSSNLTEVYSEVECDVIIAFVSIVSRAGTDIEAALLKIPATRPVVLVTLHHTFDEYYVAPDSRLCVRNRSGVFAVDCLHHEDQGLLRCLRNDEALRAVNQHLRDRFPGQQLDVFSCCPSTPTEVPHCDKRYIWTIAVIIFIIILLIMIGILTEKK